MEATYSNFEKEDILNSILLKSQAAISNCQILISSKLTKNINNTDIVIWINDLHRSLDDDHETGIQNRSLRQTGCFLYRPYCLQK